MLLAIPHVNLEQATKYATEQPTGTLLYLLSEPNQQSLNYSLATNIQHSAGSRVTKRLLAPTF